MSKYIRERECISAIYIQMKSNHLLSIQRSGYQDWKTTAVISFDFIWKQTTINSLSLTHFDGTDVSSQSIAQNNEMKKDAFFTNVLMTLSFKQYSYDKDFLLLPFYVLMRKTIANR